MFTTDRRSPELRSPQTQLSLRCAVLMMTWDQELEVCVKVRQTEFQSQRFQIWSSIVDKHSHALQVNIGTATEAVN